MSVTPSRSKPARAKSFLVRVVLFSVLCVLIENWSPIFQNAALRTSAGYPDYLQPVVDAGVRNSDNLLLGVRILIWLVGASLMNRILGRFFWDGLLVRTLGRPVPSVLKDMGTILVYLLASICISTWPAIRKSCAA